MSVIFFAVDMYWSMVVWAHEFAHLKSATFDKQS